MFNKAADKYYPIFQCGKVYYISKGTVKPANKEFSTIKNEYEIIINECSLVEWMDDANSSIPDIVYNFVKIDQLQKNIARKEVVGNASILLIFYISLYVCLT